MLKLQERGKPNHEMWLVKSHTTVGSDESCDFILPSQKVAKIQIELMSDKDQVTLKDCDTGKTSFVNEVPVGQYGPLQHGDVIRLSDIVLDVIDPKKDPSTEALALSAIPAKKPKSSAAKKKAPSNQWQIVAVGDWLAGQSFPISGSKIMGRDANCDITIPGTHLSRRHAEFRVTQKGLMIKDLDSSNGTYVNDKQIKQVILKTGDQVRFDVLTFKVVGPKFAKSEAKTVMRSADQAQTVLRTKSNAITAKKRPVSASKVTDTAADKKWKTKPTSVGNRDPLEDNYAKAKPDWFLYSFGAVVAIAAAVYFLIL